MKWIDVCESLPDDTEDNKSFLTWDEEWGFDLKWFRIKGTYKGFDWMRDHMCKGQTQFWMPLPEPPK